MKSLFLYLLLLLPSVSLAQDFKNVEYVRAYDGDTITVNIGCVPDIFGNKIGIRVNGIDTPEIRGKCQKEKDIAYVARDFVRNILENSKKIDLVDPKRGKYFRVVADVYADGVNISEELLKKGLAVSYYGGTKTKDWCK